ncbi:MAG: hypothetical protein ACSHXW_07745 [Yoonia sp.]
MTDDPANHSLSLRTARIVVVTMLVSFINYAVHSFPVSLIGFFGWYPEHLRQDPVEENFWQVLAWVEFALINGLILIVVFVLLVFILIREALNFFNGGRDAMTLDAYTFVILIGFPAMAAFFLFGLIPAGPDALAGTRAAGFGLSFLMFVVAAMTGSGAAAIVGYAVEPKRMHAALNLRRSHRSKAK